MPHDANGNLLKPGDKVIIPGTIMEVHSSGDFCNCTFVSDLEMPGNGTKLNIAALNTKQVVKVGGNATSQG